jgi:hypothetical protein
MASHNKLDIERFQLGSATGFCDAPRLVMVERLLELGALKPASWLAHGSASARRVLHSQHNKQGQ